MSGERSGAGNPTATAVGVTLDGVQKWFGTVAAVRDVSLSIAPGEIVSLLGPSGCGKTTTLRMIAGLDQPDAGRIAIGGRPMNDMPPWKRNVGMVFQSYALFPHMTVAENVAFGLTMRRLAPAEIRGHVEAAMRLVRLDGLGERRPSQLSGGQRQRVALARAIVTKPTVLLLDEPLAALDKKLREEMQVEIKQLQRQVGITTVFVTHDQGEALTLSDRVVVMDGGRVAQIGTPTEVYERPGTRFVSDFIGLNNAVRAIVSAVDATGATVRTAAGRTLRVPGGPPAAAGDAVDLLIRPEKIAVNPRDLDGRQSLDGTVAQVVYTGAVTYYHVDVGADVPLVAMVPNEGHGATVAILPVGAPVVLGWSAENMLVFPAR